MNVSRANVELRMGALTLVPVNSLCKHLKHLAFVVALTA